MVVICSMLDDAIDDLENGRVISEGELWAEIDAKCFWRFMQKKKYKIKYTYSCCNDINLKPYRTLYIELERNKCHCSTCFTRRHELAVLKKRWLKQNEQFVFLKTITQVVVFFEKDECKMPKVK